MPDELPEALRSWVKDGVRELQSLVKSHPLPVRIEDAWQRRDDGSYERHTLTKADATWLIHDAQDWLRSLPS